MNAAIPDGHCILNAAPASDELLVVAAVRQVVASDSLRPAAHARNFDERIRGAVRVFQCFHFNLKMIPNPLVPGGGISH